MAVLKAWREVAVPHADIRQGKFDASVFAADLGEVLAGRGDVDYRDATTFISKTYLTSGLSELLIDVMQRLSGKRKGELVIQLQTPFGGGKTHTLLALYHLLKKPNEVGRLSPIQELLGKAGIKQVPTANVACLVGTAINPTKDRTLWGAMAYQLDGGKEGKLYKLIAENNERKIAPGTDLLGKMLDDAGPSLILFNEILVYLLKSSGIAVEESSLRGNTLTFLQELTIAVSNCPHACMIATLTSQLHEVLEENAERAYKSLETVMGRVEKVKQTVEGEEIYEVIRRRLFEDVGSEENHRAVAEAYWQMYQKLGEDVPAHCREPGYRDALVAAYPFHPEEDRDVGDEARLSLVVLDLDQCATEDGLPKETEEFVTGILKNKGKEFRKHSNVLVFLAPNEQRSSEVTDAARRLLALQNIEEDKSTKRQLTEEQRKDLVSRLKEAEARLPSALATAYQHVVVPAEKKTLRCFDMGILGSPGRTTLSSRVLEFLTNKDQIVDSLDPKSWSNDTVYGPTIKRCSTSQRSPNTSRN